MFQGESVACIPEPFVLPNCLESCLAFVQAALEHGVWRVVVGVLGQLELFGFDLDFEVVIEFRRVCVCFFSLLISPLDYYYFFKIIIVDEIRR